MKVETRFALAQNPQNGQGFIQPLLGMSKINERVGITRGMRFEVRFFDPSICYKCVRLIQLSLLAKILFYKITGKVHIIKILIIHVMRQGHSVQHQDFQACFDLKVRQSTQIELASTGGGDKNIRVYGKALRVVDIVHPIDLLVVRAVNIQSHFVTQTCQSVCQPDSRCDTSTHTFLIKSVDIIQDVRVRTVQRNLVFHL